jgi:flagellar basal-body rod protein FlgB
MSNTPAIIDAIGSAMKHLGTRQRVIAQNIANADTPGYKSMEMEAPSFAGLVNGASDGRVSSPSVQMSDRMVELGAKPLVAGSGIIQDREISETKPDGNNVTLEDQLLKMGQIQSDFNTLTSIYRKQVGMMKAALGRGNMA